MGRWAGRGRGDVRGAGQDARGAGQGSIRGDGRGERYHNPSCLIFGMAWFNVSFYLSLLFCKLVKVIKI